MECALGVRRLRTAVAQYVSDTAEWSDDRVEDTNLTTITGTLAKNSASYFLAPADGFLLTMDHLHYVRYAAEPVGREPRRERYLNAANLLACMTPHTRTTVTQAAPPCSSTAALLNSSAAGMGTISDEAANADLPYSLFKVIRERLLALPSTWSDWSETHCAEAASIGEAFTGFLAGSKGSNPGRLGASIYVLDVMMGSREHNLALTGTLFSAAAKLAVSQKFLRNATAQPRVVAAVDSAFTSLRAQCAILDHRCLNGEANRNRAPLSVWISLGLLEAEHMHIFDSKQAQAYSESIAASLESRQTTTRTPIDNLDFSRPARQPPPPVCVAHDASTALEISLIGSHHRPSETTTSPEAEPIPVFQQLREHVAEAFTQRIPREIDFSGSSSVARDLDRFVALGRALLDGGAEPSLWQSIIMDRHCMDGAVEPRMLMPVKPSLTEAFALDTTDEDVRGESSGIVGAPRRLTTLERLALPAMQNPA